MFSNQKPLTPTLSPLGRGEGVKNLHRSGSRRGFWFSWGWFGKSLLVAGAFERVPVSGIEQLIASIWIYILILARLGMGIGKNHHATPPLTWAFPPPPIAGL
jgi:hypothetical protein